MQRSFLAVVVLGAVVFTHGTATQSPTFIPTVYDDGLSCPGGCDAHVVFATKHNGTANAFDASSSRSSPTRCTPGGRCTVCFDAGTSSCVTTTCRGAGPPEGRFDFTPAFFAEHCSSAGLPDPLARICRGAQTRRAELEKLVNCIQSPADERCRAMMDAAAARKKADDELFAACKKMGEAAFNKKHAAEPARQRSHDCAYEQIGTGRNSKGVTWKRLLDGACRPGSFAGRDGLDCCTGDVFQAALLGRECRAFFVAQ
jgi:hypothetical protein